MRLTSLKYSLFLFLTLVFCSANAENNPHFPTGISITDDGDLVMSEKGHDRIAIYSPDGRELKAEYKLAYAPTGVTVSGNQIFVTTFKTKGQLHILNLSDGKETACIETGSGASSPTPDPCPEISMAYLSCSRNSYIIWFPGTQLSCRSHQSDIHVITFLWFRQITEACTGNEHSERNVPLDWSGSSDYRNISRCDMGRCIMG